MAGGTLKVLMKVGLISEEMAAPRTLTGPTKILLSIVSVLFSYFFIHISFFGPPVAEIFKGTFMVGAMVLSILLYMGRKSKVNEDFVWLDEIFSFVDTTAITS